MKHFCQITIQHFNIIFVQQNLFTILPILYHQIAIKYSLTFIFPKQFINSQIAPPLVYHFSLYFFTFKSI